MKNFVQMGDTVRLPAPYTVVSGAGALLTAIFGIAALDIANTVVGDFATTGVYDVTALSTDVIAVGAKVFWDDTNRRCTGTSAVGLFLIGVCVDTAKANGDTTVRVRLNGIAVTAI